MIQAGQAHESLASVVSLSVAFKQKLQNYEPIDFSRFVVDLTERHIKYWTLHFETHPKNTIANALLITNGCDGSFAGVQLVLNFKFKQCSHFTI